MDAEYQNWKSDYLTSTATGIASMLHWIHFHFNQSVKDIVGEFSQDRNKIQSINLQKSIDVVS